MTPAGPFGLPRGEGKMCVCESRVRAGCCRWGGGGGAGGAKAQRSPNRWGLKPRPPVRAEWEMRCKSPAVSATRLSSFNTNGAVIPILLIRN